MSAAIDFWDHSYYKMMKILTTLVGQWPHQSMRSLILHRFVTFSIIFSQLTTQLSAAWKYRDDLEIFLDCLIPAMVDAGWLIKYINNCLHFKTMYYLLEQIKHNWTIFPPNNGLHILHYHSAFGMSFVKIYMRIWMSVVSYVTEPLQQRLIFFLTYPNVTIPNKFSMPMEFGPIDVDTWYYYLWFATTCGIFTRMTVVGACDLLLFTFSEHACGLFKGLGYAIEHLPPYDQSKGNDDSFFYMRRCAIIHSRAIDFAERVRDIYLWSFFGIIGLNMILISLTGVQIVHNLDNSEKLVKFTVNIMAQMMHFFVECFSAQRVMDASSDLKETLTNAKWYNSSKKTRNMIPLMLMRAQNPVVLTAGKVIVMNMDTYAMVLRTAASYFTVFLAMQ